MVVHFFDADHTLKFRNGQKLKNMTSFNYFIDKLICLFFYLKISIRVFINDSY